MRSTDDIRKPFRFRYALAVALITICLVSFYGHRTHVLALEKSNNIHHKLAKSKHFAQNGRVDYDKAIYQKDDEDDDEEIEFKKYVPSSERRTLAEELRVARESERNRAASGVEKSNEEQISIPPKNNNKKETKPKSKAVKGINGGINAVRNAGRKASNTMHHYLDQEVEEYEYVDMDGNVVPAWELNNEEDRWQQSGPLSATRKVRRRTVTRTKSIFSRLIGLIPYTFKTSYFAARWVISNVLWTPMLYTIAAIKWSANTSLRTTSWAGQTVFVGPVRTIAAPFIYTIEGLLFIFVWIPARVIRALIRELYPVYVFLGAGLAIGTAMGIAAAIVLYFGSFLFDDRSRFESSIHEQGEQFPKNMERYINDTGGIKQSNRQKGTKRSGSIIEDAIRESLQREQRTRANGFAGNGDERYGNGMDDDLANGQDLFGFERAWQHQSPGEQAEESDEDDDYFGTTIGSTLFKGKSKSTTPSQHSQSSSYGIPSIVTSPAAMNQNAGPYTRSIPVGATGQGGWSARSDSNSSTPMASPVYTRQNTTSSYPFTSSRQPPAVPSSPTSRVGPDSIRSHHSRQRRNVQAASPVA